MAGGFIEMRDDDRSGGIVETGPLFRPVDSPISTSSDYFRHRMRRPSLLDTTSCSPVVDSSDLAQNL